MKRFSLLKAKTVRTRIPIADHPVAPSRPIALGDTAPRSSGHLRYEMLAQELHDSVAQQLGFLAFQAKSVESLLKGEGAAAAMVSEMRGVLGRLQKQVRELIAGARIGMAGRTLRESLADAMQEFSRHSGIVFELDNRWPTGRLTVEHELQVLHIVREALANVVRHSHASQVRVALTEDTDGAQSLSVLIEDNGIGMHARHAGDNPGHYGLSIMQERARSLGAALTFNSVSAGGLCVCLRIPSGAEA